jgi:hypothetical protein
MKRRVSKKGQVFNKTIDLINGGAKWAIERLEWEATNQLE